MVLFPNAKINLGLRVTAKREDGYHDIETVFFPLLLKEALELNRQSLSKNHDQAFEFVCTGTAIPGDSAQNLCVKAYELIKKDYPISTPLRMHLHKAIPMGAGLGGGSSDGAHALKLLNEECSLNIPSEKMREYALLLGSDVPFFLINKPCVAGGRGENLKEIPVALDDYYIVLIHPGIHISTTWAYNAVKPGKPGSSVEEIVTSEPAAWKGQLINDFEGPVFEKYPEIKLIRDELYAAGATYASMTGSGSCVYGIFKKSTAFQKETISGQHRIYNLKPQC